MRRYGAGITLYEVTLMSTGGPPRCRRASPFARRRALGAQRQVGRWAGISGFTAMVFVGEVRSARLQSVRHRAFARFKFAVTSAKFAGRFSSSFHGKSSGVVGICAQPSGCRSRSLVCWARAPKWCAPRLASVKLRRSSGRRGGQRCVVGPVPSPPVCCSRGCLSASAAGRRGTSRAWPRRR